MARTKHVSRQICKDQVTGGLDKQQLGKGTIGGVNWEWTFHTLASKTDRPKTTEKSVYLSWKFDWDESKPVDFSGCLVVKYHDKSPLSPHKFDVNFKLTHSEQVIWRRLGAVDYVLEKDEDGEYTGTFSCSIDEKPRDTSRSSMSLVSDKHYDALLNVEGVKIKVEKSILTTHSKFFANMFDSYSSKDAKPEIPIKVKYEHFQRLLKLMHPVEYSAPSDDDVGNLLDLADSFKIPKVTSMIEHHLIHTSKLPMLQLYEYAENYMLDNLLKVCIDHTDLNFMGELFASEFYDELSESTKAKILDRISVELNNKKRELKDVKDEEDD